MQLLQECGPFEGPVSKTPSQENKGKSARWAGASKEAVTCEPGKKPLIKCFYCRRKYILQPTVLGSQHCSMTHTQPQVKVTYLIDMRDHSKRMRVFHINMLREFQIHLATDSNYFTDPVVEQNEEEVPFWKDGAPDDQPIIREH